MCINPSPRSMKEEGGERGRVGVGFAQGPPCSLEGQPPLDDSKCHTRMIRLNSLVISQTSGRGSRFLKPCHVEGKLQEWEMTPRGPLREPKPGWEAGRGGPQSGKWGWQPAARLVSRVQPGAAGSGCNGAPWWPRLCAQLIPVERRASPLAGPQDSAEMPPPYPHHGILDYGPPLPPCRDNSSRGQHQFRPGRGWLPPRHWALLGARALRMKRERHDQVRLVSCAFTFLNISGGILVELACEQRVCSALWVQSMGKDALHNFPS